MTEIGNVVFSVEKIDQLKAEIERLREIIRKAHLACPYSEL
jgi:organic hydroperoxide reductase OsmC/OhrA